MNNKRRFLNAALASTLALSGLALNVSAEEGPVVRLAGETRVGTSQVVSDTVYESADTVIVAGYHGEVDALTGTILAGKEDAPVLVVSDKDKDIATVTAEIKRLGASKAILLGDEKVVSEKVASQISALGVTVDRKGGHDRFDTAVEIAKLAGSSHNHVFLTNDGRSGELVDALASGPVSAREQDPILLTSKTSIPSQTMKALEDLGVKEVTIVGGKVAVGGIVESELKDAGYTVNRVAGDNRWETAVEIAEKYFGDNDKVVVANDGYVSLADALVGGYLGADQNAPILLTQNNKLPEVTENYLGANASFAYVLGGQTVVSKNVVSSVQDALMDVADEDLSVKSVSAIDDIEVVVGGEYTLPETVEITLSDDSEVEVAVEWDETEVDVDVAGMYVVEGTLDLTELEDVAETELVATVNVEVITKLEAADRAVEKFEASLAAADLTEAQDLVDRLDVPADATNAQKGALQDRINAVKAEVADYVDAVNNAITANSQIALLAALNDGPFENVNDEFIVDYFEILDSDNDTIEDVQEGIDNINVTEQLLALPNAEEVTVDNKEAIEAARVALDEFASKYNDETKIIPAAREQLTEAEAALEALELEAAKKAAIEELENYVNAEDYTENAEDLETAIAAGTTRINRYGTLDDIDDRLAAAKAEIDEIKTDLEEADAAVTTAENPASGPARITQAQELIDILPESAEKDALQARLDAVIAARNAAEEDKAAAEEVDALIAKLGNTADIQNGIVDLEAYEAAQAAYDALTETQEKLVHPDNVAKLAAAKEAVEENAQLLEEATAAVVAAEAMPVTSEGNRLDKQNAIDEARDLVNDLKDRVDEDTINELLETLVGAEGTMKPHNTTQNKVYDTIEAAINEAASGDTIMLPSGTYTVPSNTSNLTITGSVDTVIDATGVNEGMNNVIFEGITFESGDTDFHGYQHSDNLTFKDCILNGRMTAYAENIVFDNCIFNNPTGYGLWTYGAKNMKINNSTFNSGGKALLLYGHGPTNLVVNNSKFIDNGTNPDATSKKAAIEIGDDYGATYSLIINNTTAEGFGINPNGIPTDSNLWANKNSMSKDNLSVVIDGNKVY